METAQHLLARFGPALLVLIGIAECLVPLAAWRNGRWIGAAAFLAVGVPVSVAAFLATRPVVSNVRADMAAPVTHNGGVAQNAPLARSAGVARGGERHVRERPSGPVRTVFLTVPETQPQKVRRGLLHARSNRSASHRVVLVIPSQTHTAPTAAKTATTKTAAANSKAPPSNLSCLGFTRDSDGDWEAGDDTQPFDVGSATNYTIRDEGPIRPGWMSIGGVDLYALLNAKCGAARQVHPSPRSR